MSDLNCTEKALSVTGWNRARITFLTRFLAALTSVRTTNLTRIAAAFAGSAQIASHYERIRRFFGGFAFDEAGLARLVVTLAEQAGAKPPFVLSFDRTEWHLGKTPLNVLVVGIVYRGIAFPLVWNVLQKAGSSNTEERIAALERAVKIVGRQRVAFVVGDRAFASGDLIAWLRKEKLRYRLRLRGDYLITDEHGKPACADWHFRHVPLDEETPLAGERLCLGHKVFVNGTRYKGEKGKIEFLIIVSDLPAPLSDYALRWGIENLFSGLKTRGFNLEATHVTKPERLSRLMAVLALAFSWAFALGEDIFNEKERQGNPIKPKKHGRLPVSRFRAGLDRLTRILCYHCGHPHQEDLQNAARILYGT